MYVPNNTPVYLRAFSGFLSGITAAVKTDVVQLDFSTAAQMADAYAQAVDTLWGVSAPTLLELDEIDGASTALWLGQSPLSTALGVIPANYTQSAQTVIARARQGNAQVVAEGIDPNGTGSPGSGTVTSVSATAPLQITGAASVTPNVRIRPGTQSQVPVWDTTGAAYSIRQLTADDIAAGFSITSFSGGSTVEIGATVTNPAFTASYSSLPASVSIANTDGIDSPLALITPFTGGTVVGSFTKAAQATTTFTLTATSAVTKTATQAITWLPRIFGGVGTAGAVSATASGVTAILNGGAGTLANEGLSANVVGQSFGPFAPSSQVIYFLCPHTVTPHTFKDQNGFTFAMNAPTTFSFTNANGAVISMDLYQSTNVLSSNFTITVVS